MNQTVTSILLSLTLLLSCNSSTEKQKATNFISKSDSLIDLKATPTPGKYTISKDSLISQLAKMTSDTLDCSAEVYWRIIQRGKKSIPLLIESLTDTTMTNIYNHCKKGRLNIGEVSYFALGEIADFPAAAVTHMQFDVFDNGCWIFYEYFFDNKNKPKYQKLVETFYQTNQYTFEKFNKTELNDCYKKYKITGRYKWREQYLEATKNEE